MADTEIRDQPEETLAEVEARLIRKYASGYARGLDAAEYLRQVAVLTAPPRRQIPIFDRSALSMSNAEYRVALAKLGVHRS